MNKIFYAIIISIFVSNVLFSDIELPFDFSFNIYTKSPNGNDKDKDKLKITFFITSKLIDYENVKIFPKTTNGTIFYNGDGYRIVDLKKGKEFQDQFKVVPEKDGIFVVDLYFKIDDKILYMEEWYFKAYNDGVEQIEKSEYDQFFQSKIYDEIYNIAYENTVKWVNEKYNEGYTDTDLAILVDSDEREEYIKIDCLDDRSYLHNHICAGTNAIRDYLLSIGISPIPLPPPPCPLCRTTFHDKYFTFSGYVKYYDSMHQLSSPIRNLMDDYEFYIEHMLELVCNGKLIIRYVLTKVDLDQNGYFNSTFLAYTSDLNQNPALKFRLVPKRTGYIEWFVDICQKFNYFNFDLPVTDFGVESYHTSDYQWTYDILYNGNTTKGYLLYWQDKMMEIRASDIQLFSSFSGYRALAVYNGTPGNNFYTIYCDNQDAVIAYPELILSAQYPYVWIIFHEMTHCWHYSINKNIPGTPSHNFCEAYDEQTIFIEGFADWGGTYMTKNTTNRLKYQNDMYPLIECNFGECFDKCSKTFKRSEAHIMSFLWDVFDPIELNYCYDSDKLNSICVDGIEKNPYDIYSLDGILNLGFWNGNDGFIRLWDELNGNYYVCKLLVVNWLEDLICP
jgi:hypothetical protein